MSKIDKYFRLAKQAATHGDTKEARRQYRLGAVGIRSDGTIVTSSNLPSRCPERCAHAEARLVRKLDWNSEVFVVRIARSGVMVNSRPCNLCQAAMRLRGVRQVFYSISEMEFGTLRF